MPKFALKTKPREFFLKSSNGGHRVAVKGRARIAIRKSKGARWKERPVRAIFPYFSSRLRSTQ